MAALTREALRQLGLTNEQIDSTMDMYSQAVNAHKTTAETAVSEREKLKEQVAALTAKVEEGAGAATTAEEIKAKLEDSEKKLAEMTKELSVTKLRQKLMGEMGAYNPHDPEFVLGLLDIAKIEEGADGKLTGLTEQLDALKEGKSFLFAAQKENKGSAYGGGKTAMSDIKPGGGDSSANNIGRKLAEAKKAREKNLTEAYYNSSRGGQSNA